MSGRGKASGISLKEKDAPIIMGMVARGDRDHDIAAWFGVNQGRIAEVKDGSKFGTVAAASQSSLPPKGPPGVKGRRLRSAIGQALDLFRSQGDEGLEDLISALKKATSQYDINEM